MEDSSSQETGLEEVEEAELIDAFIADREIDLHVALIARVDSFNSDTQTVSLTIMQNRSVPDGSGNWITETLPALSDVPVQYPSGGGFEFTFPLIAGDTGVIICCERNIGAWRATAAQGDPGDLGMHTLDGAIFVPGIWPDSKPLKTADGSNMVMGHASNGSARVVISPSGGQLGASAADGVASGTKNDANLQALATAIAGTPATVGPTEPLAVALKTAFATWFAAYTATASTKWKTEV